MKYQIYLLAVLAGGLLLAGCFVGQQNPTANLTAGEELNSNVIQENTGWNYFQHGEGVDVQLDAEPDYVTPGTWIIRMTVHSKEAQKGVNASITVMRDKCMPAVADHTKAIAPSIVTAQYLGWDLDLGPNQTETLVMLLTNCDAAPYNLVAELHGYVMLAPGPVIIFDIVTIFMTENNWELIRYGTPWPTPTYDPLLPEPPADLDTPFWRTPTPRITPSDAIRTLEYYYTQTYAQMPTRETPTPPLTPSAIPEPYPVD